MASRSKAAPALVNLIIVINYSDTLEGACVCDMDVRARAHTHARTPRQAGQSSGRSSTVRDATLSRPP